MNATNSFAADVAFLQKHTEVVVLRSGESDARVAIVPSYQGRVMTSTADGAAGASFGWINYEHIGSGELTPHINVFGGEERFWLGPEGGQYSLFFTPDAEFTLEQWQTPPAIDTATYEVVELDRGRVTFRHDATLRNYSDTEFRLRIDRKVALIEPKEVPSLLGVSLGNTRYVGYRSDNTVTNRGDATWDAKNGLISVWMLGMYKPGPRVTVVIPYQNGTAERLGSTVNDDYFGKVPEERLKVTNDVIYFSGDGSYRSKIGVSPRRSLGICGSFDPDAGVLTIVKYTQPEFAEGGYVNSAWELQDKPYDGDAINSYNDGPPEPGADPLGPFYELETSSPALALEPGGSATHTQQTYHVMGDREELGRLARELLGVSLQQIEAAF